MIQERFECLVSVCLRFLVRKLLGL